MYMIILEPIMLEEIKMKEKGGERGKKIKGCLATTLNQTC